MAVVAVYSFSSALFNNAELVLSPSLFQRNGLTINFDRTKSRRVKARGLHAKSYITTISFAFLWPSLILDWWHLWIIGLIRCIRNERKISCFLCNLWWLEWNCIFALLLRTNGSKMAENINFESRNHFAHLFENIGSLFWFHCLKNH